MTKVNNAFKTDSINKMNDIKYELDFISNLKVDINNKYIAYKKISAITEGELKRTEGQILLDEIRIANNNIGSTIQAKIPKFKYDTLQPKSSVCTIGDSVHSAFVERNEPTQSFLATFFSLIIDLVTLGFIFLAISYTPNTRKKIRKPRTL